MTPTPEQGDNTGPLLNRISVLESEILALREALYRLKGYRLIGANLFPIGPGSKAYQLEGSDNFRQKTKNPTITFTKSCPSLLLNQVLTAIANGQMYITDKDGVRLEGATP